MAENLTDCKYPWFKVLYPRHMTAVSHVDNIFFSLSSAALISDEKVPF